MRNNKSLLNNKIVSLLKKIYFLPIILILYFFIISPLALISRLLRKDILNLKYNNQKTYWIKKNIRKINMKNQF